MASDTKHVPHPPAGAAPAFAAVGASGDVKAAPAVAAPAADAEPAVEKTPEEKEKEKRDKRKRTRDAVAAELVSTEKAYVQSLQAVVDLYLQPLKAAVAKGDPILEPDVTASLFSNIETLLGVHITFFDALSKRHADWNDSTTFGDLVLGFAPFFKMYTLYVNNHESATVLHKKLSSESRYDAFQALERDCRDNPRCAGLNLASMLIKPIQRIPRYKLLLEELQRNTEPTHPDAASLVKALELVHGVARHVNEQLRASEGRRALLAIQDEFHGEQNFVAPHRAFIRKGKLTRVTRSDERVYTFFLFNDLLIYAEQQGWKYKLHRKITIDESFAVEDIDEIAATTTQFKWKILSAQKSFVVHTATKADKESWLADLRACIDAYGKSVLMKQAQNATGPTKEVAAVWQPDGTATGCSICSKKFTIVRRKHHCRKCGALVCDKCSKSRLAIAGSTDQSLVRICDRCKDGVTGRGAAASLAVSGAWGERVTAGSLANVERPSVIDRPSAIAGFNPMAAGRTPPPFKKSASLIVTGSGAGTAATGGIAPGLLAVTPPARPIKLPFDQKALQAVSGSLRPAGSAAPGAGAATAGGAKQPPPRPARAGTQNNLNTDPAAAGDASATPANTTSPATPKAANPAAAQTEGAAKPAAAAPATTSTGATPPPRTVRQGSAPPAQLAIALGKIGRKGSIIGKVLVGDSLIIAPSAATVKKATVVGGVLSGSAPTVSIADLRSTEESADYWVWLPHKEHAYIAAKYMETGKTGRAEFRTIDGEVISADGTDLQQLSIASENIINGSVDNLAAVRDDEFSEGAVMHQVRERYKRDNIYTYMGGVLVSVNPFKMLNGYYSSDVLHRYRDAAADDDLHRLPPHIWSIAAAAYTGACGSEPIDDERPEGAPAPVAAAAKPAASASTVKTGVDQSIVISGESGAGKTESTKLIIQYLSEVAGSENAIEQEILQSTPLLEAFGNAKTVRNDNSSRFGKWMCIRIRDSDKQICGGDVSNYLLEKTRVVSQAAKERSYHIFYQLCAAATGGVTTTSGLEQKEGAPAAAAPKPGAKPPVPAAKASAPAKPKLTEEGVFLSTVLHLRGANAFQYLNQSGCTTCEGMKDEDEFAITTGAMKRIGFKVEEMRDMWRVLAGVLHLGNVTFTDSADGGAEKKSAIADAEQLKRTADILQVEAVALTTALTTRSVIIKGSTSPTLIPLRLDEAIATRDALSKALYGRLFDWLVQRINKAIARFSPPPLPPIPGAAPVRKSSAEATTTIGILDIYGFEVFANNSLEQFCINYANEKLQDFFNHWMFKSEQRETANDGLADVEQLFAHAAATDPTQQCLELIEKKLNPMGVLKMMDEELLIPNSTDATLHLHLCHAFGPVGASGKNPNPNPCFEASMKPVAGSKALTFSIRHYAGKVVYQINGFLEKNRDKLHESVSDLLLTTKSALINSMFAVADEPTAADVKSPATPTAGGALASALTASAKFETVKGGKNVNKKDHRAKLTTLGSQFSTQLSSLLATIRATEPHFVRCIKPNNDKQPFSFDAPLVLSQARNGGLLETLRIRRAGFPYRKAHREFVIRYTGLISLIPNGVARPILSMDDPKVACETLIASLKLLAKTEKYIERLDYARFKVGRTLVFYHSPNHFVLESLRIAAVKRQNAAKNPPALPAVPNKPKPAPVTPTAAAAAAATTSSAPETKATTPTAAATAATPAKPATAGAPPPTPPLPAGAKRGSAVLALPPLPEGKSSAGAPPPTPPLPGTKRGSAVLPTPPIPAVPGAKTAPALPGTPTNAAPTTPAATAASPKPATPTAATAAATPAATPVASATPATPKSPTAAPLPSSAAGPPLLSVAAPLLSPGYQFNGGAAVDLKSSGPPVASIGSPTSSVGSAGDDDSESDTEPGSSKSDVTPEEAEKKATARLQRETTYLHFLEAYTGKARLVDCKQLRSTKNYLKGTFRRADYFEKRMLIHQKDSIVRSLYKLDVTLTGSKKVSETLEKYALQIFDNILCYARDKYHAYPVTCGHAVLERGYKEPLLRDEIYLQLVKQSANNPSVESCLRIWKLLFLVIKSWSPSPSLMPIVASHVATHSHRTYAEVKKVSTDYTAADVEGAPAAAAPSSPVAAKAAELQTVMDVASQCSLHLVRSTKTLTRRMSVAAEVRLIKLEKVLAYTNEDDQTAIDAEDDHSEVESDEENDKFARKAGIKSPTNKGKIGALRGPPPRQASTNKLDA